MSQTSTSTISIDVLSKRIVHTLLYSEVFDYPLTEAEIIKRCSFEGVTPQELQQKLQELIKAKAIQYKEGFYFINTSQSAIDKRVEINQRAKKFLPLAFRVSQWIGRFPFVKAVMLSGSISKDCMHHDSDIDYFIICEPKRVWVLKGLLAFVRKVVLLDKYKYFCTNYIIDTESLPIQTRNIFTAMEIVTLIPTYGKDMYQQFMLENKWVSAFHPLTMQSTEAVPNTSNKGFKKVLELLLDSKLGDWIDNGVMHFQKKRYERRYRKTNPEMFKRALKADKNVSKCHHLNHQTTTLAIYQQKVKEFERKFGVSLRLS